MTCMDWVWSFLEPLHHNARESPLPCSGDNQRFRKLLESFHVIALIDLATGTFHAELLLDGQGDLKGGHVKHVFKACGIWRVLPLSRGSYALRKTKIIARALEKLANQDKGLARLLSSNNGWFRSLQHPKTRLRSLRRIDQGHQRPRKEDNSKELITEEQSSMHS